MYSSNELFQRSREGYLGVYDNKHQNNTRMSAETVRRESVCIILFHTRHNGSINEDKATISAVSHSLAFRSADDVTIDYWWRHNDQTIVTRSREYWYVIR